MPSWPPIIHDDVTAKVDSLAAAVLLLQQAGGGGTAGGGGFVVRTTSYTVSGSDAGVLQICDSPTPMRISVPANLPIDTYIPFVQWGEGAVTVEAATVSTALVGVRSTQTHVSNPGIGVANATYDIVMPPTVLANDGLLTGIEVASSSRDFIPPADFVAVGTGTGPSGAELHLFKKQLAVAADQGAVKRWTVNSGIPATAVTLAFANSDPTDFIDGITPADADTTSRATPPPYTTLADGVMHLSIKASSSGTAQNGPSTPPAGLTLLNSAFTQYADANSQIAVARGDGVVPPNTSIGGFAWTHAVSQYGTARTIGIKPASAPAISVRASGDARKTAARFATGAIHMLETEVLVDGYLVAP